MKTNTFNPITIDNDNYYYTYKNGIYIIYKTDYNYLQKFEADNIEHLKELFMDFLNNYTFPF